jgi:hypothetical protein
MAILYDILEKKELYKYPPLPNWILDTVNVLIKIKNKDRYFDFTSSIMFDPFTNTWTRSIYDSGVVVLIYTSRNES